MRRTKIICTIGPASERPEVIRALIEAGMNVARLNMSHGSLEEHAARIRAIREEARQAGQDVGILLDIQGPKIRLGQFGEPVVLDVGDRIRLTSEPVPCGRERVSVSYPYLARDLTPGRHIFIDDGLIELLVEKVEGSDVICQTLVGGELRSRKGVSLPGVIVDLPPATEEDAVHLRFGVEQGVDWIAASFVRRAEHVETIRSLVRQAGGDQPIMAKIESEEGLSHIDEIIAAADGVMVARGDLGVETPLEEVPLAQQMIVAKCNEAGKPVVTATQMLESMVQNHRPTRAEVTDVAHAIFDGTDAVMLSGETAVGRYPVDTVRIMARICERMEAALPYEDLLAKRRAWARQDVAEAISYATCQTAADLGVAAILTSTQSGSTARMVSKYRPHAPIVAVTPDEKVARRLCLVWGVEPLVVRPAEDIDEMLDTAVEAALKAGLVQPGQRIAISAGVKTNVPGSTNLLQVLEVTERGRAVPASSIR
ncbi:MAG: pyruvate kinase [Limnochordaceae bacterium]|nr:pyruvate kinase [Limnochordaceae bacterium]